MVRSSIGCLTVVFLLAGCRHDDAPGVVSGAETSACTALGRARCAKEQKCRPNEFPQFWEDMADCVAEKAEQCRFEQGLPDARRSAEHVSACASATEAADCDGYLGLDRIRACDEPPGTRKQGDTCADALQCQSLVCAWSSTSARCGRCIASAQEGEACGSDNDCYGVLTCKNGRCGERGRIGASCTDYRDCNFALECVKGTCARPTPDGAHCEELTECLDDSQCVSGTCTPTVIVQPGGNCRGSVYGPNVWCTGGYTCDNDTCVPLKKVGEACTLASDGIPCRGNGWCWSGVCELPNAAWCPASGELDKL
ncbi:MAG TPA: hypothetical protein VN914_20420 [Polyangia bacterium]|nr:hypothetical protein [Polyangia bacterium]